MNYKDINDNPISNFWEQRTKNLSIETRKKLEELKNINPKVYQLKVLKKSKIDPKIGDVFVLSPREGLFFYGKVLESNIRHIDKDIFVNEKNVIVIFKCQSPEINLNNYSPQYNKLLINPIIVDSNYWKKGYFQTIANIPLDENDINFDYGFYSIGKGKYFKSNGEEVKYIPNYIGTYGVATISGVAYEIEKELIIDPTLLDV